MPIGKWEEMRQISISKDSFEAVTLLMYTLKIPSILQLLCFITESQNMWLELPYPYRERSLLLTR